MRDLAQIWTDCVPKRTTAPMLKVSATRPAAVTLNLPLPPSANALWKPGGGRAFKKSAEYEKWLVAAGWHCVIARARGRIPYRYHLLLTLPEQRADIDNRVKALGDLLQTQGITTNDRHMRSFAVVIDQTQLFETCTVELWNTDEAPPAPKKGRAAA
jgi:Holliday junction resolvase RusA-like endonuclease